MSSVTTSETHARSPLAGAGATRWSRSLEPDTFAIIPAMDPQAPSRSGRVLKALAVLGAMVLAFFAGVLVERLRFDVQRTDMLRRYD